VNWRLSLAALGGVVGGILWAARRKRQLTAADSELWAEATDPVARFGDG
jgi:hypothetical protein